MSALTSVESSVYLATALSKSSALAYAERVGGAKGGAGQLPYLKGFRIQKAKGS